MTDLKADVFLIALKEFYASSMRPARNLTREDQEDALQEAALALCRYRFESVGQAQGYLWTVYRYRLIDSRRKRKRLREYGRIDEPDSQWPARTNVEENVIDRERLRLAVESLSERDRDWLRDPSASAETLHQRHYLARQRLIRLAA